MSKRSLLLLTIVTTAVMMLPITGVAQETPKTGPKMELPDKILDFGVVPRGEEIEANFKVNNKGTAPLVIKTVRPTCGCTIADHPDSVEPGGQGIIKAKLDTMDFSGPINKTLLLMTDDPETPSVSLVIKAMVQPFFEILPRALVRLNTTQSMPATEKIFLVPSEVVTGDYKITGISCENPFVNATYRVLDKSEAVDEREGKQYEITLSLSPDVPPGPYNAKLMVQTNHPKAKQVPVKVFGVIRALLNVTPMSLPFGTVEAGMQPGQNVIVVNNRPEGKVNITEAVVDDPAFATEIQILEPGKRYQIAVTIKPDAAPGPRNATLRISTTDSEFPELTVPIRASIK